MIHSFDDGVAVIVGVKGAILLHHIGWWVKRNEASDVNCHDGRYWTYNTSKAYEKLFPFWSGNLIQKELKKLENEGYLLSGNFNKNPMDRTKWYTLGDKTYEILHYCNQPDGCFHSATSLNGFSEKRKTTNIQNKTYSNKHSNNARTREGDCSSKLAETLTAFAEHRKKLKKPMTDYAKKLLLSKLQKLANTEEEQIAILNQSIENGWQGVFPLGGNRGSGGGKSAADMADSVKQKLRDRGLLHDGERTESRDGDAGGSPAWFSVQQGG